MRHGVCRPLALIAGVVAAGASRPAVFQRSRRGDLLLGKHTGYLGRTVPRKAKAVYPLPYGGGFFVNDEIFVLILVQWQYGYPKPAADKRIADTLDAYARLAVIQQDTVAVIVVAALMHKRRAVLYCW